MRDRFLSHWRGILLSLVGIVAICWLALTDRLGLYIHPRYFVFTVVMAVVAGVLCVLGFVWAPSRDAGESAHEDQLDYDDGHVHTPLRFGGWWAAGSVVVVAASVVAMLALPAGTLSTSTAAKRAMNSTTLSDATTQTRLVGGDTAAFTVKDWANLMRQPGNGEFLRQKTPTLVGFVTPDADDPAHVFYVSRFVVTCCAVDAQPVGVPVYLPGWRDRFHADEWVKVTGAIVRPAGTTSTAPLVVQPTDATTVAQPADPYVY